MAVTIHANVAIPLSRQHKRQHLLLLSLSEQTLGRANGESKELNRVKIEGTKLQWQWLDAAPLCNTSGPLSSIQRESMNVFDSSSGLNRLPSQRAALVKH